MKAVKSFKFVVVGMSVLAFVSGCAKKAQTSQQVSASFKLTGSSSAATVVQNKNGIWDVLFQKAYALVPSTLQDSSGLNIQLSKAWVVVKEVEFKTEELQGVEDSEIEVEFAGPYVVDLLSTQPLVLDTQKIAEKPIRRIKMDFHKAEVLPSGAPAELLGNSIFFAGMVGGHSFEIRMKDSTEIEIHGPNAFTPSENSELMVQIQLANVLKQVNMASIIDGEIIDINNKHAGSNLCPQIDSSSQDIYTCIRKGLDKYSEFGVDDDRDDDLDSFDTSVK